MKKRDKRSRLRGRRTCGYGARKKHRGSGSKGGKGMAGTGKKAGQKKTWVLKYSPGYLGRKKGFVSLKQKRGEKLKSINLAQINEKLSKMKVEKTDEGIILNLKGFKVLGRGSLKEKLIIKANAFSEKAKQKISSSGGKAIAWVWKTCYSIYLK